MFKTKNISLWKAIAMGVLVAKSIMGAEEGYRRGKEPNKAIREVEMAREGLQGSGSGVDMDARLDTAVRISELLKGIEDRKEKRRNLLRQPRIFDLSLQGVDPVVWHLDKAREFSEQRHPVKVALKLFNIVDWQLNQILNHPYANHIEGLDWTYQPVPSMTRQHLREEGEAMDTVSRIRGLLEEAEKRKEERRNLLRQLRAFDLSVQGVDPVVWHLNKAHELSEPGNPVKVAFKLFNIVDWQLHQILSHPHANHIEGLDWMPQPIPAVMGEERRRQQEGDEEQAGHDRHKANFIAALRQIVGRGVLPRNELGFPVIRAEERHDVHRVPVALAALVLDQANRNVPVENADYIEGAEGGEQPVIVAQEDNAIHGEEAEQAEQPVPVALEGIDEEDEKREEGEADDGNGVGERAEEDDPVGLQDHVHAKLSSLKRAAARRREAPLLTELNAGFEEDKMEPSSLLVEEAKLAESKDKAESTVSSWKITPVTAEDIRNAIQPALQNLGSPNLQARQATSNLVNVYCRHVPGMIRVQS
ncbi:MAG: hypothetical protein K0R52_258 [Alphaproteobacteria bacterium]|jgi:hypothetical protein|nr:hypothetical protein [Alphaproteobacteria bacterium]